MKKILHYLLIILSLLLLDYPILKAQIGGQHAFEFLTLSPSARVTALGGYQIAVMDEDVNMAAQNPALYNEEMDTYLSLNNDRYFADLHHSHVAFAKHIDGIATFGASMQFISYGDFTQTDGTSNVLGNFSGGEYAFSIGAARREGKFSYGTNLKFITSSLDTYRALGIAADFGVVYYDKETELGVAAVAKNIGYQLTSYTTERESLPFDLQIGVTKKLKYMPFRFSIVAHHLNQWDIRYDDPNQVEENSLFEEPTESNHIADKIFRHLTFNGELYLGKALRMRFGYNHLRRQELGTQIRNGLTGFSFGAGIHTRKFQISYGRAIYHLAGGNHHFTLSTKLNEWTKRKKRVVKEGTK